MSDADKMRAENQAALDSIFDAMRQANLLISPSEAECKAYIEKHFHGGVKCHFVTPANPLTIGNPHHNDPLDPENQQ